MTDGLRTERALARLDSAAFCNTSLLSPLRYPGGKRRILPYIARAIAALPRRPSLFVEPFAGGSSVSVGLLEHGFVCRVGLADADPLVAAFWMAVFDPKLAPLLAEMTAEARLTLPDWHRMRAAEPRTVLGRAFKCLYLNRTSFSGVLNRRAGPIGGQAQAGAYTVASRFPRERLAERILKLAKLAPRVAYVRCQDWRTSLATPLDGSGLTSSGRMFWYLDPPFWNKAERLYRHFFTETEHKALAVAIRGLKGNWVLSYDMDPGVVELYHRTPGIHHVSLRYTARSRAASHRSQELLFSNLAVARGLAKRSLAIIEGGVESGYVEVHPGMPGKDDETLRAA